MPFYEYQCAACGRHHEELQKVGARPLRQCPYCGRPALKRLVSAPAFRLKGGGWYETDFKKDQEGKRNLAGDKEPAAEQALPAEKTKESAADAAAKDAAANGQDAKAKPAEAKPAEAKTASAGAKHPPARKTRARRRTRR